MLSTTFIQRISRSFYKCLLNAYYVTHIILGDRDEEVNKTDKKINQPTKLLRKIGLSFPICKMEHQTQNSLKFLWTASICGLLSCPMSTCYR